MDKTVRGSLNSFLERMVTKKGRRQRAFMQKGFTPMPIARAIWRPTGSKGIKPLVSKASLAPVQEGFESPSEQNI
jgi:hypothetical protein